MKDTSKAIVFIDCQYVRESMQAYAVTSISTINILRKEFPTLLIVVLSTSFPSSTLPYVDQSKLRGAIGILDRDLHSQIGGIPVAIYGDYGSIHAVVYDDVPVMRWSPRIDYAGFNVWAFERRTGLTTEQGYIECAKGVVSLFGSDMQGSNIWGERMILDAANGHPYGKAPASWIAVRVNIHLSRQIDYAEAAIQGEADLDDLI